MPCSSLAESWMLDCMLLTYRRGRFNLWKTRSYSVVFACPVWFSKCVMHLPSDIHAPGCLNFCTCLIWSLAILLFLKFLFEIIFYLLWLSFLYSVFYLSETELFSIYATFIYLCNIHLLFIQHFRNAHSPCWDWALVSMRPSSTAPTHQHPTLRSRRRVNPSCLLPPVYVCVSVK